MNDARGIGVGIVDDQSLVREGLKALVNTLSRIHVVFDVASAMECLERIDKTPVDVLVADIRMPKMDGVELVRNLRQRGNDTPVMLLTTFDEPGLLDRAIRVGARGFLLKDASPEEFESAIGRLAAGQSSLHPVASERLRSHIRVKGDGPSPSLTEREAEILRLVAGGCSNKEIGRALGLVEGTVKNYLSELLIKLESRDRTQAVLKAISMRLI
jgi:DNA-binding NarL/FixJ family response regulator